MRKLVLLSVALSACEGPTIPPRSTSDIYPFHLDTAPPSVLRWPSGSTIRVFISGGTDARAAVLEESFAEGAAQWNATTWYADYELVRVQSIEDADVLLRWSDQIPPVDLSGCQPEISRAVTTFCLREDDATRLHVFPVAGSPEPGSVRMVVSILTSEASRPDGVRRLVAHELGHVLGIAQHSPDSDDLMFGRELTRATLSRRDQATVRVLYRTEPGVVP